MMNKRCTLIQNLAGVTEKVKEEAMVIIMVNMGKAWAMARVIALMLNNPFYFRIQEQALRPVFLFYHLGDNL